MRLRASLTTASLVVLFATPGAEAQETGPTGAPDCGMMSRLGCSGGGPHNIDPGSDVVLGTHGGCLVCLSGPWYICHPECNETFAAEDVRATYAAVLQAANLGEVGRVVALARRLEGFVTFNNQRNAVQVLSCQRTAVVASLPVPPSSALRAQAAALSSSSAWTSLAAPGR